MIVVCMMVKCKRNKEIYRQERHILQELLKDIRKETCLSQQELADRLGKPQSFVSKYEAGERRLDILELRRICQCMGISLAAFVLRLEILILENNDAS